MFNDAIIIALIASSPGIIASIIAYRKSIKASETASKTEVLRIEAEAYGRARKSLEAVIDQLEEQVQGLRRQVSEEQDVSSKLRTKINDLEETVSRLRSQLIRAGIELPPDQ